MVSATLAVIFLPFKTREFIGKYNRISAPGPILTCKLKWNPQISLQILKNHDFWRSLFAMLFGTVFGSLFPPIFGSLRATFFSFFCPEATVELNATHIYVELLAKCASEPRNPPKMVAQSPEILQN